MQEGATQAERFYFWHTWKARAARTCFIWQLPWVHCQHLTAQGADLCGSNTACDILYKMGR